MSHPVNVTLYQPTLSIHLINPPSQHHPDPPYFPISGDNLFPLPSPRLEATTTTLRLKPKRIGLSGRKPSVEQLSVSNKGGRGEMASSDRCPHNNYNNTIHHPLYPHHPLLPLTPPLTTPITLSQHTSPSYILSLQ